MDPKPGDHLIRLVEPVSVGRRRVRGQEPEWTIQFRMEDGHVLHVGLKNEAALAELYGLLRRMALFQESPG